MATSEELDDEARRAWKVRRIVDISTSLIVQGGMTRQEAEHLVSVVKAQILELFPGADETFEVVYAQRFRRIIDECCASGQRQAARVLTFHARSN